MATKPRKKSKKSPAPRAAKAPASPRDKILAKLGVPPIPEGMSVFGGAAVPSHAGVEDIPVDRIEIGDKSDREHATAEDVARMIASIERHGQMQNIGVVRPMGDKGAIATLIWGEMRLRAARALGWKSIRAAVYEGIDDSTIEILRAVENAQRADPNAVDQAEAVLRLVDRAMAEIKKKHGLQDSEERSPGGTPIPPVKDLPNLQRRLRGEAFELAAAWVGKPVRWVRDNAFLARLSGDARKLVLERRLPVPYAREISTLADPSLRDDLAHQFATVRPGQEPMESLDDVRMEVARHRYSLAVVPWQLDRVFVPGTPACSTCPANSANNPGLFETGGDKNVEAGHVGDYGAKSTSYMALKYKEPKAGVCTNPACYQKKAAAANSAIAAATRKGTAAAKEAPKTKRFEKATTAAAAAAPEFVRREVVVDQVKRKLEAPPPATRSTTKASPPGSRAPKPEDLALAQLTDALRLWVNQKVAPALGKFIGRTPGAGALLQAVAESREWRDTRTSDRKRAKAKVDSSELRQLLLAVKTPSLEGLLTIDKACLARVGVLDGWYDGPSGLAQKIVEIFGLSVPAAPVLEDFLPQAHPDKAAKPPNKPAKRPKTPAQDLDEFGDHAPGSYAPAVGAGVGMPGDASGDDE